MNHIKSSTLLTSISIILLILRSVGEGLNGTDPPPTPVERDPGREDDVPKEGGGREEGMEVDT